jgi:hypothetical protein
MNQPVLDRRQSSERGLASAVVIGPLDPGDDGDAELVAVLPAGAPVQDVALEEREERFHGALSPAEPTWPIEPTMPWRARARWTFLARSCDPRSE